jgi:hypothetical protein
VTAEAKMRQLAQDSTELQTYFFTDGQVRWFDVQLQPNYLKPTGKTCVRVRRVSTVRDYAHETSTRQSVSRQAQPLFQFDVLDYDSERARSAAAALRDWFATVDFSSDSQFASPPTSPTRHPNRVVNERAGMFYDVQPPAYVISLDVRIFDLEQ